MSFRSNAAMAREGEAVRLFSDALDNPKRPYLEGRKLLALVLEVFHQKLSKIAHFKLLRDIVKVVVIGHSILGLKKAPIEPLI